MRYCRCASTLLAYRYCGPAFPCLNTAPVRCLYLIELYSGPIFRWVPACLDFSRMPDAIADALSLQVLHSSPTFARPRGSGFHRLSQTVRVIESFPTQARFVVAPPCCGYCRPTRCRVGHGLGRRGWFPPPAPFVAAPALLEARGFSGSAAGGACCVGDLAHFVQVASPDKTRRDVACVSRLAPWFCDSS